MTRALAMMSGGLDSTLAAKLIKDQGIEVIGICFKSYFFGEESAKKMCEQIGIELKVVNFSREHFEMVKNPKHGWGKNMNPCIDCHAMMMNYAGKLLEEYNADFIVTGEVLNQRPMSQNKQALNTVKNESGFANKILRPLCALNLEPTEMEISGLVDREKLMKISGRSRKVQMELANKWGLVDYPSPAGGCKLTEPNYSVRLRDALDRKGDLTDKEIGLLRFGRHFLTPSGTKVIVSRTSDEGEEIKKIITKEDTVLLPYSHKGAMGIILGDASKEDKELAARIVARYTKGKDAESVVIKAGFYKTKFEDVFEIKAASDEEIEKYII